jgi:hypothetical protein
LSLLEFSTEESCRLEGATLIDQFLIPLSKCYFSSLKDQEFEAATKYFNSQANSFKKKISTPENFLAFIDSYMNDIIEI